MTDWKFGECLKLNKRWQDEYPTRVSPGTRLMFLSAETGDLFIGIYLKVDGREGAASRVGSIHSIFSRKYWEPDE